MSSRDELRAKAQELLQQAKAAAGASDSLLYVMRALEYDREADLLEERLGVSDLIGGQTSGNSRENA